MSGAGTEGGIGPQPMSDLKGYLVKAFLVTCALTALAEVAVFQVEDRLLAPVASALVSSVGSEVAQKSALGLISRLPRLLAELVLGSQGPADALRPEADGLVALLLLMQALALLPIVVAAVVFAFLVDGRVRAVQEAFARERRREEQERNLVVADLAHDLRTPVTSITALSQALADDVVSEPERRREYLRTISHKALAVGDMVNLLVEYAQLDSEGFRLERRRCDLAELLLEVAAEAYADAEREGVLVVADVPERPCPILADPTQLTRVFSNLVANAVRHNPCGTTVAVSLERRGTVALASVADTGTPLPEPTSELLRPFSRGDSSRSTKGFGLGLSVAKRISDKHGFGFALRQPAGAYTKAFVVSCPILEEG